MANRQFPYTPELKPFQEADDAWTAYLRQLYGKRAGDVRYTKTAEGIEGGELRRLFNARLAAQAAWHQSAY